jgi:hypothetical protein
MLDECLQAHRNRNWPHSVESQAEKDLLPYLHLIAREARLAVASRKLRFARDSPLEEAGFEPSVPLYRPRR